MCMCVMIFFSVVFTRIVLSDIGLVDGDEGFHPARWNAKVGGLLRRPALIWFSFKILFLKSQF